LLFGWSGWSGAALNNSLVLPPPHQPDFFIGVLHLGGPVSALQNGR